jgi:hypothetical protein
MRSTAECMEVEQMNGSIYEVGWVAPLYALEVQ